VHADEYGGELSDAFGDCSCFIGRQPESICEKSKRIHWLEAWICAYVVEGKKKEASRLMWDWGMAFQKSRRDAREIRESENGRDGGMVDGGLAPSRASTARPGGAQDTSSRGVRRPSRYQAREYPKNVTPSPMDEIEREDAHWRVPQPETTLMHRNQVGELRLDNPGLSLGGRACAASSVYSRDISGLSRRNTNVRYPSGNDDVDDIISLYRRSTLMPDDFKVYKLDPADDDSVPPVP